MSSFSFMLELVTFPLVEHQIAVGLCLGLMFLKKREEEKERKVGASSSVRVPREQRLSWGYRFMFFLLHILLGQVLWGSCQST